MEHKIKNSVIPNEIIKRWQDIVDAVADLFSVPCVAINRLDPPELEAFRTNSGLDNPLPSGIRMSLADAYCRNTIMRQRHVVYTDARTDPEMAESIPVKAGFHAYMGYPLFWPEGEIFGTICVLDNKVNMWKKHQDKILCTFKDMIETHLALVFTIDQLESRTNQLQKAYSEVKTLKGMLPICTKCKKIRDDKGYWDQIESYIKKHSEAEFSHSICPECAAEINAELDKM